MQQSHYNTLLPYIIPDDGDEELIAHDEISSRRQLYSIQDTPATALPDEQIPIGSLFVCSHDKLVQVLHCCVPQIYNENPKLGLWVKEQRSKYKSSKMTIERDRSTAISTAITFSCHLRLFIF